MPGRQDPSTVYIIDDDASVRSGLARLMRSAGIETRLFASPEAFLQEAGSATGGVVLLDITMPGTTGTEMQARLRDMDFRLPTIVVSATENDETRETALALGARFFLRKPVDGQALLDVISWVTQSAAAEPAVARHLKPL